MNNNLFLGEVQFPALILSSKAGLGNHSVGNVLKQQLDDFGKVYHFPIEELVNVNLSRTDFHRYRQICDQSHWLLYLIYTFPINFCLKYLKELIFKNTELVNLKGKINSINPNTIICTNHRSAFWASSLKRKKEINPKIITFITDHYLGPGWKFIFWSEINNVFGPLRKEEVPAVIRKKFIQIDIPVKKEYLDLSQIKGNKNEVLITGGGWGLGPIYETTKLLHGHCKDLKLHVVCGTNNKLLTKLKNYFQDDGRVSIYGELASLAPVMRKCASVITKPGAVTVTEAYQAGRKIYLLAGLPIIEENNRIYEIKNFSAQDFSLESFVA